MYCLFSSWFHVVLIHINLTCFSLHLEYILIIFLFQKQSFNIFMGFLFI